MLDGDTGERWRLLQLGRTLWRELPPADAADCLPSITAWITAECRVRLWKAACVAGFENVTYLDTDAMWLTRAGTERLRATPVEGLRVKAQARSLQVLGPRQLVVNGSVKAAGIAHGATLGSDGRIVSEAWRGLLTSLRRGETDSVTITPRVQRLTGTDRRREHLPNGRTAPFRLTLP